MTRTLAFPPRVFSEPYDSVGVLPCPTWCTAEHTDWEWAEYDICHSRHPDSDVDVRAVLVDSYEAEHTMTDRYVWVHDREVSPAEARRIAAALLAAADIVEAPIRRRGDASAATAGDVSRTVAPGVESVHRADTGPDMSGGAK
jgi:hypothetical protein